MQLKFLFAPLCLVLIQANLLVDAGAQECAEPGKGTLAHLVRLDEIYEGQSKNASWMSGIDVVTGQLKTLKASDLTYGEILPEGFLSILQCIGARAGQRFFDLGSGTGKIAVLASLFGLNSTGIELVPSRWEASCRVVQKMNSLGIRPPKFIYGSFADVDFSDADLIFMNSVTYPEDVLDEVAAMAKCLTPTAKIVTAKTLLGHFELTGACWANVSWSSAPFEYSVQQLQEVAVDPSLCERKGPPMRGEIC